MNSNNNSQQRGNSGNGAGSYSMIMKNANSLNFYNNLQPQSTKGDSTNLNGGGLKTLQNPITNTSSGINENNSSNFYSHQPKVLGRTNMEFLNGFSNLGVGSSQNNGSVNNQVSSSVSASNIHKKESPKGQPKLFQDFQSLFLNSPSHTQRINNVIGSSFNNNNEQQQQQQSQQSNQVQNVTGNIAIGGGSNANSQSTNLLKTNNSKLLFQSQQQAINSPATNITSPSSQSQQNSPYYDFKKVSRTKVNNFFNDEEQEKRKDHQQSSSLQKNGGVDVKGISSTLYNSMVNGKVMQENNYPGQMNNLKQQNNNNNNSNINGHVKKVSKDFEQNNSNSQRNTQILANSKQQFQLQQQPMQQSQITLSPKQQLQQQQQLSQQNGQSQASSMLINNTKDNTNSYAYQHMQQQQQQQQNGLSSKNQFYRPPSSDRNWRNATLKTMNTTQIQTSIKKKEQSDQFHNSYEPSKTTAGYSSTLSVMQNNSVKQNFSPRNQSQNPSSAQDQSKGSMSNYVTKLNRGDDLIGQALQNQNLETGGGGNNRMMRNGNNDQQDSSSIGSFQADSTKNSNGIKKDTKGIANSLRNSTVINQNNALGNVGGGSSMNQNNQNGQSSQMRSNSAQKDYKTSTASGYLQTAQSSKPYNLALSNSTNWMPSYQKPQTTKETKHKNFLFFENSEILNGNKSMTPKNEIVQNQNQVSSRSNVGTGYSRQPSNYNVDLNNSTRNQQQQVDSDAVTRCVTPKTPIHQDYYMPGIEKCYKLPLPQDYFSQISREHFMQTFQGIQYAALARPANPHDLQQKKVFLKNKQHGKKTLIFDLDETLIHCNENASIPSDVVLSIRFPQGEVLDAGINIRPYAVDMLKELCQDFEIVVFTASHSSYAKAVLDHLDPHKRYIHHRFFRDQCIMTPQGVYIKDLRIFADRAMNEMVLVDNAAYSFAFQIENGIPIIPFYENKKDEELKSLTNYLKSLKDVKDVREINKQAFKFHLYSQYETAQKVYEKLFQSPPSITKIINPSKQNSSGVKTTINNYFQNKNSPASNIGSFQQKQTNFAKNTQK